MDNLLEWLSVSDEVSEIAYNISDEIINDVSNRTDRKIGKINSIPFVEGNLTHKANGVIGNILVVYTIYYCNDDVDYRMLERNGALNCFADSDNNTIYIVSALIRGRIKDGFVSDISHEVEHLYQYSNGMAKNVNLYDSIMNVINDNSIEDVKKYPAYLVYYTFKHEVDAFATQFYHMLKEYNSDVSFSEAKSKFYICQAITGLNAAVNNELPPDDVKDGVRLIGLTLKQWKNRVKRGTYRLEHKLMNVYHRYCIERLRSTTVEGIVSRQLHLYGQYQLLKETIEPIYELAE